MNKRKFAVQFVALVVAYGLACSDPRELLLHPAGSPTRNVSASAGASMQKTNVGKLSIEQVASVVRTVAPSVSNSCWQPRGPTAISPRVSLRLTIEPAGSVSQLELRKLPARFQDLGTCVAQGLRPLQFADGLVGSNVEVSFVFSGQDLPKLELWAPPPGRDGP